MKENRALFTYAEILEGKTDKLREILGIGYPLLDDRGPWWRLRPCTFTLEDKELLKSLQKYIRRECLSSIKEIKDTILFLKTDGEKGKSRFGTLDVQKNSELAEEELAKCLERTGLDKKQFFEEVEYKCEYLSDNYKELIDLIEYLMK